MLLFKDVTKTDYYKICTLIMNQTKRFTFDDIKNKINVNDWLIKRALKKLMNNGLIIKHGSFYSIYQRS